MSKRMVELGYGVVSGGTDNHLILVDLKPQGVDGARVQVGCQGVVYSLRPARLVCKWSMFDQHHRQPGKGWLLGVRRVETYDDTHTFTHTVGTGDPCSLFHNLDTDTPVQTVSDKTVLDEVHITLNKNSVPGDKSAIVPGGIRIGAPALTTRGFKEAEFVQIADFIDRACKILQQVYARYITTNGIGQSQMYPKRCIQLASVIIHQSSRSCSWLK
eukprot:1152846-Pelagomonas_calceolata.AAC.5